MTDISTYALVILVAVGLFGAVLGLLRLLHHRKIRSLAGVIERLEDRASEDVGKSEQKLREVRDEDLLAVPALYGIPYLAWILTSVIILGTFLGVFFENLVKPYELPELRTQAWHDYRAPADFELENRRFSRHDLILEKGSMVTFEHRRIIARALAVRGRISPWMAAGTALLLIVLFFILLYHINILYPVVTEKNRNLILIYLTVLVVVGCAKLSLFYGLFPPLLIPVTWAGLTITILINRRIVPLTVLITLLILVIESGLEPAVFIVLLTGGLVSGSWVRSARKRSELMLASVLVGSVMALTYVSYEMLAGGPELSIVQPVAAAFMNGVLSGLLVLIFLPIFEMIFDFASPFRLMELLDLNTPLMKEFFFKAPGSYQHSMAVANIAESVANELGLRGLLVRVGAYYHDIGKMFNPEYFVENQAGENPHDELGPIASAAVVRSHVILGVRLARQIGLPGPVVDFIPEHHGTSTIDYFYFKSREAASEIKSERVFKYPGPKPHTKETALVMLVDSVEAAFRVKRSRDEESIRQLVHQIANRKLEQGELDQSGLTIGELKKITETLTHIMKSSGHERIAYPEKPTAATTQPAGDRA